MGQISPPSPGHKPQEPANVASKGSLKPVDKRVANRVLARLGLMIAGIFEPRVRQIIGEGKDKLIVEHERASKVYMLPQASFLSLCKRNIEKEVGFINAVKAALVERGGDIKNLAVDITVAKGKRGAWEMDKAVGNLEKKIVEKNDWTSSKSYCLDLVRGMQNLHKAGYVHGDVKLENLLLYRDEVDPKQTHVKVSDFGKGAKVNGDKSCGLYSGNTRYGPPEGKLSKAGDVYGAGICLIRMLEEPFLSGDTKTLISVPKGMQKVPGAYKGEVKGCDPNHGERRGVEKFILDNAMFTRSYEQKGSFQGKVLDFCARVRTAIGLSKTQLTSEQVALNGYINDLTAKLKDSNRLSGEKAGHLNDLLKKMTDPNPAKRPSMESVYGELESILAYKPTAAPRRKTSA